MNEQTRRPRPDTDPDQRTGRLLEEWLGEEAPVHEPPVAMPNVRARVALTRRRPALLIRDWWRWRPGRSDRRFLGMNTATQLAAVAVLALSGFGLFMVANVGPAADSAPPGAATLDPDEVMAKVAGTAWGDFTSTLEATDTDIGWVYEDELAHASLRADDPRLDGMVEMSYDWIDFKPDPMLGAATISAVTTISNEEGAWEGTLEGICYPDEGFGYQHLAGALTGSGAYEGLTAYLFLDSDGSSITFEGLIFPGDMPE